MKVEFEYISALKESAERLVPLLKERLPYDIYFAEAEGVMEDVFFEHGLLDVMEAAHDVTPEVCARLSCVLHWALMDAGMDIRGGAEYGEGQMLAVGNFHPEMVDGCIDRYSQLIFSKSEVAEVAKADARFSPKRYDVPEIGGYCVPTPQSHQAFPVLYPASRDRRLALVA